MVYSVYTIETFDKETEKISRDYRLAIDKIFLQLKESPYVGDQIRFRFFREKRIKEKRIYYLVYDNLNAVLIVAFGGKKAQQETIDEILRLLPEFRKYMNDLLG